MRDLMFDLTSGISFIAFESLILAALLRAATKWVQKMKISFGDAYLTMLLWSITFDFQIFVVDSVVNLVLPFQKEIVVILVKSLFIFPPTLLILASIVTFRLRIPFKRACLVMLTMFGMGLILYAIFLVFAYTLSR